MINRSKPFAPLHSASPLASTTGMTTRFSDEFHTAPRPLRALIAAHEGAHLRQRRNTGSRLPEAVSSDPVYRQMLELDAAIGSLATPCRS